MENKEFKGNTATIIGTFSGLILVLYLSVIGNPNALGEALYWGLACLIFAFTATIAGVISYVVLSIWEKINPHKFLTMKRKTIVKINRAAVSWFAIGWED